MRKKDFIDEINIFVRAGNGGAGSQHLYRGRCIPKGGPDGGDGGNGGSIILEGKKNIRTLLDFRYRKHLVATHGTDGSSNQKKGRNGEDLILPVPVGTVIQDENGVLLDEILAENQKCVVAKGGRGGLGNTHFKSAVRQTPRYAQSGQKGEVRTLKLELKILADVGLVGFPNAGKSTLLSVLSAARPKIADYPFTTLTPNLGIVFYKENQSFVMADIPGLIEKASEGKGLGFQFLRHIERSRTLLFVIPADEENVKKIYAILKKELHTYDPRLLEKKHLIVITKIDLVNEEKLKNILEAIRSSDTKVPILGISSFEKKGLVTLKRALWECIVAEDL